MPRAREHHRDAVFVGRGDHFIVAHAAAGFDHAGRARVHHHIEPVAEREESIGGYSRAGQCQARILRLDARDARRIDAAHLACAHAEGHAAAAEHDRIALDEFRDLPGEQQIIHLLRCRLLLGHDAQFVRLHIFGIGRLHEQAAAHAFEIERIAPGRDRHFEQAHILFGREHRARFRRDRRGHQHFDELLGHHFGRLAVERTVEGDDAAEGRGRVGLERL